MAHVVSVRGIGYKKTASAFSLAGRFGLADRGLDLAAVGVSTSMIYWADSLHAEPHRANTAKSPYEAVAGLTDDEFPWIEEPEQVYVQSIPVTLQYEAESPPGDDAHKRRLGIGRHCLMYRTTTQEWGSDSPLYHPESELIGLHHKGDVRVPGPDEERFQPARDASTMTDGRDPRAESDRSPDHRHRTAAQRSVTLADRRLDETRIRAMQEILERRPKALCGLNEGALRGRRRGDAAISGEAERNHG